MVTYCKLLGKGVEHREALHRCSRHVAEPQYFEATGHVRLIDSLTGHVLIEVRTGGVLHMRPHEPGVAEVAEVKDMRRRLRPEELVELIGDEKMGALFRYEIFELQLHPTGALTKLRI